MGEWEHNVVDNVVDDDGDGDDDDDEDDVPSKKYRKYNRQSKIHPIFNHIQTILSWLYHFTLYIYIYTIHD